MSWIKDVVHELGELDVSKKSLKKFGLTIGGILFLFGIILLWRDHWQSSRGYFIGFGIFLFLVGLVSPQRLINIYKVWMGFAFALGWMISRLILIILFVFVLTPLSIFAKIFGKKFLDLKFKDGKSTYWIPKEKRKIDYEKMF